MKHDTRALLIIGPPGFTLEAALGSAQGCGWNIVQCTGIGEALERLRKRSFDAVLLAPDADPTGLRDLRASSPGLPVLALTAAEAASGEAAAVPSGVDDHLPIDGSGASFNTALRLALRRADAARAAKHAARRFRELYQNLAVPAYALDLDGSLTSANPAMLRTFGYDTEGALLEAAAEHALFADAAQAEQWLTKLRRDGRLDGTHRTMTTAAGRRIELIDTVYPMHDMHGKRIGYLGSAVNVTEAHELSRRLAYEATHDPLTSLPNRREMERQLTDLIGAASSNRTHALCYVDLDLFKVVNDTCGHAAGDELLRQLSAHLMPRVAREDTLARVGGDEFALLLRDRSIGQAAEAAQTLLQAIGSFTCQWQERHLDVRASIGVVPIDAQTKSLSEILGAADAACYTAKEKGRNRVHVQEPGDKTVKRRISEMHLVVEAKHALRENRMKLFHQPILPIASHGDAQTHFEVLIRMQDWDGEYVAPGVFLPAVERYNLSRKVDRWVLTNFLQWIKSTPGSADGLAHAGINLSGNSIGDQKFLEFVLKTLDEFEIAGDKLCFEVTETAAVQNLASARHFITTLKKRGCRFALDDFGSGLSSFGYLKNLPVDFLKIDGMFVRGLREDPTDRVIVKSISDVAHSMGLLTIAEFVEDAATLQITRELGIDFAQGYAIGRPAPLDELPAACRDARSYGFG